MYYKFWMEKSGLITTKIYKNLSSKLTVSFKKIDGNDFFSKSRHNTSIIIEFEWNILK